MTNPLPNPQKHSFRSRSWQILLVLLLVAVVMGMAWQVVRVQRGTSQQQLCRSRLKQLGLAMHEYHEQHGMFPPAYTLGPDGKRWHSWRVLLLPFLGEPQLLAEYHFDEPWDGPWMSSVGFAHASGL